MRIGVALGGTKIETPALDRNGHRRAGPAHVVNILAPPVIVLGGRVSRLARLCGHVAAPMACHVFADRVATRILPPRHGDASGVRGTARLWAAGGAD
jgi:fructokinase